MVADERVTDGVGFAVHWDWLRAALTIAKDPVKAAALFAKAALQGVTADPGSFALAQLQNHFYAIAYQVTGETRWEDSVSIAAGGGQ